MENSKVVFGILDMICTNGDYIIKNYPKSGKEPILLGKTVVQPPTIPEKENETKIPPNDKVKDKFVRFARFAGESLSNDDGKDSRLETLPSIPKEIFGRLPKLLQDGCKVFTDEKERDVFLTGSLGVLSGCVSPIRGAYDQRIVYANLNVFAVAPAASGKGALVFAKALGQAYHDKIYKESIKALRQYEKLKKTMNEEQTEATAVPKLKLLYIPGNVSAAALITNLQDNDGKGILCETEADTIANALKQDWGGFSDLIRKAGHHEAVSSSRKTNKEVIQIDKPQLSIVISGTPSQVTGLIKSVADGLFSRFVFYAFKSKPEWRDVSPISGAPSLTVYFEALSVEVLSMVEFLQQNPAEFQLTPEQFSKLNSYFKEALGKLNILVGEDVESSVKRHGLISYRIAMVLSAIRKYEKRDTAKILACTDEDFDTAMKLTEIYLQHSIYMMSCLPKAEGIKNNRARKLFDALPTKFQRQEAVEFGKGLGIGERTTDKYLNELVRAGLLKNEKYVGYEKT